MAHDDQLRWDKKHAADGGSDRPAKFLVEVLSSGDWRITAGRALDVACGTGRNALYLAAKGFDVTGIDISEVALAEARRRVQAASLPARFVQADLEALRLPEAEYDLIINFNYLQRSLIAPMFSALKIGGHIIFETFLIDQKEIGHPKNPHHLLGRNELLQFFSGMRVLYYREGQITEAGTTSFRARLLAERAA
jgi:SAM-dependent methyltransferase